MANKSRFCEKCGAKCCMANGYVSIKPNKFPRYKHVCFHCKHLLGGYEKVNEYLLPIFQAEGWKGTQL